MRIIAGAWRGRRLLAPDGPATRPTSDRARQALFDRLRHAPWAGPQVLEGATVLDAFAGTGALGLEALSRGAAHATFLENARPALAALRANIAACRAEAQTRIIPADARHPPPGTPCTLVFLDPPYHQGLIPPTLAALAKTGWLAPDALLILETASDEPPLPGLTPVAAFETAAARLTIARHGAGVTAA